MSRLNEIVEHHRRLASQEPRSLDALCATASAMPTARSLADAIRGPQLSVIAEVKRRSPSAGVLASDLDPAVLSGSYVEGGAAAISVLTDQTFFGGSVADLQAVRAKVEVPVLRKDFTVSRFDVVDARLMGADVILLIVAALNDSELIELSTFARELDLSVLVEIHDHHELERALSLSPAIVGVNQRDLRTFEVNTELALQLRDAIPDGVLAVAESGMQTVDDVQLMADAGFDAVLVGSALVTAGDATSMVAAFSNLKVRRCS